MKNKMRIVDRLNLSSSSRKITPEGYLMGVAAITSVGVQQYMGSDFGVADEVIYVYRPPETVFHPETIESAKMKPIVYHHPEYGTDITSENHSRYSVGNMGETIEPLDECRLGANIAIKDKQAVDAVIEGEEQVSLGYDVEVVRISEVIDGYQCTFKFEGPMIINHLAIEEEGRCGDTVKILDKRSEGMKKKDVVKLMKATGFQDAAIKAFLPDKGDDHEVTDGEMASINLKDAMNMGGLMEKVAATVGPMLMEQIGEDENFMGMLANAMATMMMGEGGASMMEEKPMDQEPMMEEKPMDQEPGMEEENPMDEKGMYDKKGKMNMKAVNDAVNKKTKARTKLIDKAGLMISDADERDKLHSMSEREIIIAALGDSVDDVKDKSTEYLMGILDMACKDRLEARNQRQSIADKNNGAGAVSLNALSIRKMGDK